jgi:hypothetical protein
MYCADCQEHYDSSDRYCLVCGAEMTAVETSSEAPPTGPDEEMSTLQTLLDVFGIDFRHDFETSLSHSKQSSISVEYASSLGKVTLDKRMGVLWNCTILLGPLKINAITSDFGALPFGEVDNAKIVKSNPEYGECTLANADEVRGSIVLMKRGAVTFAEKALRAAESGAICVVVIQTADKWPFVMTDSAKQIEGEGSLPIPVVMVNVSDGTLLEKLISSGNKHTKEVSIRCSEGSKDCIICHEEFEEGNVVLKLPCAHAYHEACVMAWLESHHTCPMCRHEMPAAPKRTGQNMQQRRAEEEPNARQGYFV